ncbi:MAG TPA: restriction endonuclease subunit S, partial [Candidatus Nitrosocosmicus sp.]|nr:restriction endonuclease subunit S [Candidatus Nitrosocosmicus sp.]
FIGKRIIKKDLLDPTEKGVYVYSANVFQPIGSISNGNIKDFTYPSILWGIDGNFDMRYIPEGIHFATTDHCGTIQILNKDIVPEYLLYALIERKIEESFDRSFRASLSNMKQFIVRIPVIEDGSFDVERQKNIAERFVKLELKKKKINEIRSQLNKVLDHYS